MMKSNPIVNVILPEYGVFDPTIPQAAQRLPASVLIHTAHLYCVGVGTNAVSKVTTLKCGISLASLSQLSLPLS